MAASKRQRATAEEVEREASRYIVHELGDRLWAGAPNYDEQEERWTVPVHTRALSAGIVLGTITLDVRGRVVQAPSRVELQRSVRQHQANGSDEENGG